MNREEKILRKIIREQVEECLDEGPLGLWFRRTLAYKTPMAGIKVAYDPKLHGKFVGYVRYLIKYAVENNIITDYDAKRLSIAKVIAVLQGLDYAKGFIWKLDKIKNINQPQQTTQQAKQKIFWDDVESNLSTDPAPIELDKIWLERTCDFLDIIKGENNQIGNAIDEVKDGIIKEILNNSKVWEIQKHTKRKLKA